MGYTHYWDSKPKITKAVWEQYTDFVKEAIKEVEGTGIPIKGPMGTGKPIINSEIVSLNGNSEIVSLNGNSGDSHETFYFERILVSGEYAFCKTARKPYDVLVIACLIKAKELQLIRSWSSDGNSEDHTAGEALYNTICSN